MSRVVEHTHSHGKERKRGKRERIEEAQLRETRCAHNTAAAAATATQRFNGSARTRFFFDTEEKSHTHNTLHAHIFGDSSIVSGIIRAIALFQITTSQKIQSHLTNTSAPFQIITRDYHALSRHRATMRYKLIAHKDYITIVKMAIIKPVDNEKYDVCLALYDYLKFGVPGIYNVIKLLIVRHHLRHHKHRTPFCILDDYYSELIDDLY
jgi:hypothetical protein